MKKISDYFPADCRALTESEIKLLCSNGNRAQSWDQIRVSKQFDPELIVNCTFYGDIYLGASNLNEFDFEGVKIPGGISNSTFSNCIVLNNAIIHRAGLIANYVIENNAVILNSSEISSNSESTFGSGFLSTDRSLKSKIYCVNENGGRYIIPFESITCSDAYLFIKNSHNTLLIKRLEEISRSSDKPKYGPFGYIGASARVLNTKTIRNSVLKEAILVDGAELIDNSTVISDKKSPASIGSGVQISNSIIGYGNDIRSACQIQFTITGSSVSISQSARITHSFIGDNSAISCCEIAHAFLFPSHAQHHNNSFLIAALIGGQSNIAAGATIGSNHNSRVNDGELWASRGFWPGLCTSFKHNSKFASFVMIAKSDYPAELNVPYPFSLLSNDNSSNSLTLYPAWWISNNMYALMRSRFKFGSRDKRIYKLQNIEHSPFAPDTINEIVKALVLLELHAGMQWSSSNNVKLCADSEYMVKGHEILGRSEFNQDIEIKPFTIEKSNRKVILKKPAQAWKFYRNTIKWYAAKTLLDCSVSELKARCSNKDFSINDNVWINAGGQILKKAEYERILTDITSTESISNWDTIHNSFNEKFNTYSQDKTDHALSVLLQLNLLNRNELTPKSLAKLLNDCIPVFNDFSDLTKKSRQKDFEDPFRAIVYESHDEETAVLGDYRNDSVILKMENEAKEVVEKIEILVKELQK